MKMCLFHFDSDLLRILNANTKRGFSPIRSAEGEAKLKKVA